MGLWGIVCLLGLEDENKGGVCSGLRFGPRTRE
jgi:hypothetical protein